MRVERLELTLAVFYGVASLLVLSIVVPVVALFARIDPTVAREVFGDRLLASQVLAAFRNSLLASAASVAILVVAGTPLAYVLARESFPGKRVVEAIVDIPFVMPHAVAGIMILSAYGGTGLLGGLVEALGLRVEDTFTGIVAVMAFVSAPLYVDTVKAGIASVDPTLEAVARTLGATRLKAVLTVTLPLAARHILAGALLAWARALSEVGALLVVAYHPVTLNILIINYLHIYGLPYAVVVSAVFAAFIVAAFMLIRWLVGT